MARRPGSVDLTHGQLLQAIALLNHIENAAADIARDRPELDEFVGTIRMSLREVRAIFRTPQTVNHAVLLRRLLDEVDAIDHRLSVH
ncbi:MAG: hypothetical protein ABI880_13740 [Acidobacteriota bacterium]